MENRVLSFMDIDGLKLLVADRLLKEGVLVAFSTRKGGVGRQPYDELNLAFHVGDDPEIVLENRRRLCAALGVELDVLTCAEQVHGSTVVHVEKSLVGRGGASSDSIRGADALAADVPECVLAIFTADCVPIALVDSTRRIIAAVHAGWRGTEGEIVKHALKKMTELGSKPGDIAAFFGPAIGPCCYEVGEDLAERFKERFGPRVSRGRRLDLTEANAVLLREAGLSENNMIKSGLCTSCRTDIFYSFRTAPDHVTGRQGLILSLLE